MKGSMSTDTDGKNGNVGAPRQIALSNGGVAVVDAADYERLARWKWRRNRDGYAVRGGARRGGKTTTVMMHQQVMGGMGEGQLYDHVSGQPLDNRRVNLRPCTTHQNAWNKAKQRNGRTSRFKGVHWKADRARWRAKIRCEGRDFHIGLFTDEEDAARAYDARARDLFGDFARLNFPEASL